MSSESFGCPCVIAWCLTRWQQSLMAIVVLYVPSTCSLSLLLLCAILCWTILLMWLVCILLRNTWNLTS